MNSLAGSALDQCRAIQPPVRIGDETTRLWRTIENNNA
jgi:hypothetical protein